MGDRGPVPLRSDERRRANEPDHPIWKLGPGELSALPFEIDLSPKPPTAPSKSDDKLFRTENPDAHWGKFVSDFYDAIKRDPMVAWMTSADWATLMIVLEDLDRELKPQVVGVTEASYSQELGEVIGGEAITAIVPMKGAKMSALVNMLKAFGIGEANRLRMQKEVQLFQAETAAIQPDAVEDIVSDRLQLLQGGQS